MGTGLVVPVTEKVGGLYDPTPITGDGSDIEAEAPGVVAWMAPGPKFEPGPPGLTDDPDASDGRCDATTLVIFSLLDNTTGQKTRDFLRPLEKALRAQALFWQRLTPCWAFQ